MLIFKEKEDLSQYLKDKVPQTSKIGFVPTMGALHEGHLSLILKSQSENEITISSIFVNPTQFNDPTDLAKYPRPIEEDIKMLSQAGCSILFLPSVEEIYPKSKEDTEEKHYDLGNLENILEGKYRKGHFQGVVQIIDILLKIINPQNLYLGQKDYQQCLVIKSFIQKSNPDLNLVFVPTLREEDGLAMSSRNRRLTETQRAASSLIYQCLISIQTKKSIQQFKVVQKECFDILTKKGFDPDYIELADASTLEILEDYDSNKKMVALIAVRIGDIRLIDNVLL